MKQLIKLISIINALFSKQQRTSGLRKQKQRKVKLHKCKVCKTQYQKMSMMHVVCSPQCAETLALAKIEKRKNQQQKEERKKDREKKEKLKKKSYYESKAQDAVNEYVRTRDMVNGYRCISSGRALDWNTKNMVDAGHYRSVGSAPHLRYHLHNIHAQSKRDNRDLGGNHVAYRIGLIERIGVTKLEALEADNVPRKYSKEQLSRMAIVFRKKTKRLLKRHDQS